MLYRQAGVRHTDYGSTRTLYPIPADRYAVVALLALALAAPVLVNGLYLTSYLLPWLVWTAAALGLNLVLGWAGQFHLGYAAVMAVGAYTAVHSARAGVPWEIAILLGGTMASAIGTVFAFAALRVKGLYLALTTLAMQFVMDWVLAHVPAISGGTHATLQAPALRLLGQPLASDAALYYFALAWCLLVTMFMLNLGRTALGRALVAVREKDYAAAVLGINSFYYKQVAFAASSFIGGVSGAVLIATFYQAVTPEQFTVNVSIQVLAMVIVGGLASVIGTYLGAALILLMPGMTGALFAALSTAFAWRVSPETLAHLATASYGAVIVAVLLLEPLGLGKIYANVRNYLLVWPFGYNRR